MLQLEVNPRVSLSTTQWEFALGMHFSEITGIIQQQARAIKNCIVKYNESCPLEEDFCIDLVNDGILLVFDAYQQCLKSIEVYNMKNVKLSYFNNVFNAPEILPSLEEIDSCFGATIPAVYDGVTKLLNLKFPGLCFYFPCEQMPAVKIGMTQKDNESSLLASKMVIYSGRDPTDIRVPDESYLHISENFYAESIQVLRVGSKTQGLRFKLQVRDKDAAEEKQPCFKPKSPVTVLFGMTCQEIICQLGGPDKIFYKSEDKMKIHGPKFTSSLHRSDFFLNYFSLGLDILIDSVKKVAKKFVLHTNFPGHYDFNIYRRCKFNLPISIRRNDKSGLAEQINVSSLTMWKAISSKCNVINQSIVLNRSTSTNTTNPFGSTYCKAYEDLIFEIIPNGHIASITLYQLKEST